MQKKTLAQRGALRRASKDVGFAVDTSETTSNTAFRQDLYLAARYGLTPAVANLVAELALTTPENWRRA